MTKLDFNHRNNNLGVITKQINDHINIYLWQKHQFEPARKYLGASQLGLPCSRALQYEYKNSRFGLASSFDAKSIRIFAAGHLFEELLISWLQKSGFDLVTRDKDGKQLGFKVADSRIAGHIDGVITAAPKELGLTCPCLWETKSMNNRNWNDITRKGLVYPSLYMLLKLLCIRLIWRKLLRVFLRILVYLRQ
ncbi:hypothetical protein [Rickettsia hoogstraalii]|uniref:hypothetical protein n=1 Tax=Rickettsia hoogstraalii TaxID=467174 RepID=UPI000A7FAFA9|nr:hypothetical protein [Rickettsia hoogstraalii]